jgi:dTDP-4-dehydrorhamnose reductase
VVSDQIGSPTYVTDLAGVILEIIKNKEFKEISQATQIYHYSNKGEISWYVFAKEIFELVDIKCLVNPIMTEQYPTPAKRPKKTSMDRSKIIRTFNVNPVSWRYSLKKCLMSQIL